MHTALTTALALTIAREQGAAGAALSHIGSATVLVRVTAVYFMSG